MEYFEKWINHNRILDSHIAQVVLPHLILVVHLRFLLKLHLMKYFVHLLLLMDYFQLQFVELLEY